MQNCYEKLCELKKLTDDIGQIYGTEDFAIYLYSLVRMFKPKTILELGTGLGTTSLWMALALEENQEGIIHTIDNGSEWQSLKQAKERYRQFYNDDYKLFVEGLIQHFNFNNVKFYNEQIDNFNLNNIDILFSDFSHDTFSILNCFAMYLSKMSENSYIFIDSASTHYTSRLTILSLLDMLNANKIPKTLLEMVPITQKEKFKEKVSQSSFQLIDIIENKNRNQNSTACIKINPIDLFPNPRINIRF